MCDYIYYVIWQHALVSLNGHWSFILVHGLNLKLTENLLSLGNNLSVSRFWCL